MRIAVVGALAPIMALGACGEAPLDGDGLQDAQLEGDVQMQAGLYRTQITLAGGPGGTAGSQFADDTQCLTPEDVAGGYREMLLSMQGRDSCRFETYEFTGDALDAVMVCTGDQFQPETRARIAGTVTPTATDLRMTVAGFGEGGGEGEGAGGVDMQVATERIGECPESAQ